MDDRMNPKNGVSLGSTIDHFLRAPSDRNIFHSPTWDYSSAYGYVSAIYAIALKNPYKKFPSRQHDDASAKIERKAETRLWPRTAINF